MSSRRDAKLSGRSATNSSHNKHLREYAGRAAEKGTRRAGVAEIDETVESL